MVVEEGKTYECTATTDGDPVKIKITISDEDGAYTWSDEAQ